MAWKISRCKVCKKIVATLVDSPCATVCCGQEMDVMVPGTTDGAREKHVPAVVKDGNKVKVAVGSVEHPMMEKHYIQFIAINTKLGGQIRYLTPEDKPNAEFLIPEGDEFVSALELCNLHGLWEAK